jgi:hypothetical protein
MTETASRVRPRFSQVARSQGVTEVHSLRLFEDGRLPRITNRRVRMPGMQIVALGGRPRTSFLPRKDIMDNKQFDDFKDLDADEAGPNWTNMFDNALWQCEVTGNDPIIYTCLKRGKALHLADLARRKS